MRCGAFRGSAIPRGAGRRKANLRRFLAESVVTVDHMIVDTACTVSPYAFLDETPTAVMIRRIPARVAVRSQGSAASSFTDQAGATII